MSNIKLITILSKKDDINNCEFGGLPHKGESSIVFYLSDEDNYGLDLRAYICCSRHFETATTEERYFYVSNKYLSKVFFNCLKKRNREIEQVANPLARKYMKNLIE